MPGKAPVALVVGFAVVVLALLASYGWRNWRPAGAPPVATATAPIQPLPSSPSGGAALPASGSAPGPAPAPSSPTPPSAATAPSAPAPVAPPSPAAAPPSAGSGSDLSGAAPQTPANAAETPQFDVVRVQPGGDTVVAGRTAPGAKVALLAGTRRIGEATADAGGQFVILPDPLPVGEHLLALELQLPGRPPVLSRQNVSVRLPGAGQGEIIVALTQPDAPTRILSDASPAGTATPADSATRPATGSAAPSGAPPDPAAAAPPSGAASQQAALQTGQGSPVAQQQQAASPPSVAVRTVEAEESGAFFATGVAPPGAQMRLYLNDTIVATVTAGQDGAWALKVERGMAAGNYAVRADHVDPRNGQVVSRAEVTFAYPESAARAAAALPAPPQVVAASPAAPSPAAAPASPPAQTGGQPPAAGAAGVAAGTVSSGSGEARTPSQPQSQAPAPGPATAAAQPDATAPQGSVAVVQDLKTATVNRGDSLWRISRQVYGRGIRYTQIYEANTDQIRNPRLIYPGQVLVLPQAN